MKTCRIRWREEAIGKAVVRREGNDLSIISYGMMALESLQAAEQLAGEGIDCHVLDLRTIAPLDREAILDATRRTGKIVVVHEDHLTGGVGGEVAAIIAAEAFEYLDGPIVARGGGRRSGDGLPPGVGRRVSAGC